MSQGICQWLLFGLAVNKLVTTQSYSRVDEYLFWYPQGQLVSIWQDLSQSELGLNQQLSEFYDTLLSTWHAQLQWSSQVRPVPNCALSWLYRNNR